MSIIKYCNHCSRTKENVLIYKMFFQNIDEEVLNQFFSGYIGGIQDGYWSNNSLCPFCKNEVKDINISLDDVLVLAKVSNYNRQLLDAMITLNDKDIIEYELKMSQFRAQVNVQNEIKQQFKQQSNQQSNQPKCPTCGSTNIRKIGTGERVASVVGFGIFSKKINKTWKCNNCGYTW